MGGIKDVHGQDGRGGVGARAELAGALGKSRRLNVLV